MNNRYFLFLLLGIELLLLFQFSTRIVSILQTSSRIESKKLQRDMLKSEYESKESKLVYVRTDLYVEEIARQKLRYSKEGEHIYILPSTSVSLPDLPSVSLGPDEGNVWGEILHWYKLFFS